MEIWHKSRRFPNYWFTIVYALYCLGGNTLGQVFPYIDMDEIISLQDKRTYIPLLEVAFQDPDWITMVVRNISKVHCNDCKFQDIGTNHNCDSSVLQKALRLEYSLSMQYYIW